MKSIFTVLVAAAIFQGCRGHAKDSDDPGTSAGNDTITVIDRHGKDRYDNFTEQPGSGNTTEGFDSTKGGNTGSTTGGTSNQGSGNTSGGGTIPADSSRKP